MVTSDVATGADAGNLARPSDTQSQVPSVWREMFAPLQDPALTPRAGEKAVCHILGHTLDANMAEAPFPEEGWTLNVDGLRCKAPEGLSIAAELRQAQQSFFGQFPAGQAFPQRKFTLADFNAYSIVRQIYQAYKPVARVLTKMAEQGVPFLSQDGREIDVPLDKSVIEALHARRKLKNDLQQLSKLNRSAAAAGARTDRCYNCQEMGHHAKDCPHPRRGRGRRGRGFARSRGGRGQEDRREDRRDDRRDDRKEDRDRDGRDGRDAGHDDRDGGPVRRGRG